ncbi:MAG TPA: hypothetical protein VML75_04215 [Kofleriaceae bacterium]|nr:hypothetical protein [Kofleriaceae bacterium]
MAGIAVLCMVAQLLSLAHLVVVEHERCHEHGELIHGDGHEARSVAPPAPSTATPTARVLPGQSDEADGDHDHCLSATERRDLRLARVEVAATISPDQSDAIPRTATTPVVRALYRSAPKTSPPHLA